MATVANNIVLHGASGKLGDMLVIRQQGGRTILSVAPGKRTKESTESQKEHQSKFQQAILYGKSQMADENSKAEYEAKADGVKNAFNIAVADFFHAPDIVEVDMSNYHGNVDDVIRIRATDDFSVESVHVEIINDDGSQVEAGEAVRSDNEIDWFYTATVKNDVLTGDKIIVKAMDRPGNVTEDEEVLT